MPVPIEKLSALMAKLQNDLKEAGCSLDMRFDLGILFRTAALDWGEALLEELDDRHECCTVGCGAILDDGWGHRSCPTCAMIAAKLAELRAMRGGGE